MANPAFAPSGADWTKFYNPATTGFMEDPAYTADMNQERYRQAILMAEQAKQAKLQTGAMGTSLAQASLAQSRTGVGGVSPMPSAGGIGGGVPTGGISVPGAGTVIPNYATGGDVGTTGGVQTVSEQLRYDPWAEYRGQAGEQLAGQMGQTSPSDIYKQKLAQMVSGEFTPTDPSYQFRFKEGQRAAERSLASRGLLNSGNAAIELQQRGQEAASQEYGAQFGRLLQGLTGVESTYNTQIGRLMEMAGVNVSPTAGGQLNVQQGQLGIERGKLGLSAQEIANQWTMGQQELAIKQQLANQAATGGMNVPGTDWSAIFRT